MASLVKRFVLVAAVILVPSAGAQSNFLKEYTDLDQFVFREPSSQFYLGVGISPLSFVNQKLALGMSAFQAHYITPRWDITLLNAMFQFAFGGQEQASSRHYLMRSSVKLRLSSFLSVGPLVGYEVLSFPQVLSSMRKGVKATKFEPFSSRGLVYGAELSQLFRLDGDRMIRLSQFIVKQTYRTTKTPEGWEYDFTNPDTGETYDPNLVKTGIVVAVEASYLF